MQYFGMSPPGLQVLSRKAIAARMTLRAVFRVSSKIASPLLSAKSALRRLVEPMGFAPTFPVSPGRAYEPLNHAHAPG
jgi:hypothetical protein